MGLDTMTSITLLNEFFISYSFWVNILKQKCDLKMNKFKFKLNILACEFA